MMTTSLRQLALATATTFAMIGPAGAQELKVGLSAQPSSIDPLYQNLSLNDMLSEPVLEGLVNQDPKLTAFDLAGARKRLADAGYPNSFSPPPGRK
jgi:ABC-type transport system substrate-binding protein